MYISNSLDFTIYLTWEFTKLSRILKYFVKLVTRVDISPLDSTNLSFKVFIFLLWGISFLFFNTKELTSDEGYSNPIYKNGYLTLTEKYLPAISPDVHIEFRVPPIGVLYTYNINPVSFEFINVVSVRGPPRFI